MENPFDHNSIASLGLTGLGNNPSETLAAYLYFLESRARPHLTRIDSTLPIHDRLLEAALIIFDVAIHDKSVIKRLRSDMATSPCVLKEFSPYVADFFTRLFCELDLPPNDVVSKARLNIYMVYFNNWLDVWIDDETPDQSETMAAIDQNLSQLKEWKDWITHTFSF
eukprot:gene29218-38705_t